jgi:hypothetical protein
MDQPRLIEVPGEMTYEGKTRSILEQCAETGEPIFIFRARDVFALNAIFAYQDVIERYGPRNLDFQRQIVDAVAMFKDWQREHANEVRFPD